LGSGCERETQREAQKDGCDLAIEFHQSVSSSQDLCAGPAGEWRECVAHVTGSRRSRCDFAVNPE
jgi:hypothetical protein